MAPRPSLPVLTAASSSAQSVGEPHFFSTSPSFSEATAWVSPKLSSVSVHREHALLVDLSVTSPPGAGDASLGLRADFASPAGRGEVALPADGPSGSGGFPGPPSQYALRTRIPLFEL